MASCYCGFHCYELNHKSAVYRHVKENHVWGVKTFDLICQTRKSVIGMIVSATII